MNAVSGGQANSVTITEAATATPTSGDAALSIAAIPSGTFHFSQTVDLGLATNSITARQSGSRNSCPDNARRSGTAPKAAEHGPRPPPDAP